MKPVRIGVIGMGGFAGEQHDVVARLQEAGEFQLVCACDPAMESFAERRKVLRFAERGVRVFTEYQAMLDACRTELDMVAIPTPIPLHAPMHRACVERGIPVYLEKPPTLDCVELEQMIALDATARWQTNVGFNMIVDPDRRALKRRLAAGEFGVVRRATVYASWPRNATYYSRTNWAGRLKKDGRLILDSCIGNALSHLVHNTLFWCGSEHAWAWSPVTRVQAELYRARSIESMDTVFVSALTDRGVEVRVAMSHACKTRDTVQEECVICEQATVRYYIGNSGPHGELYTITWNDGRVETGGPVTNDMKAMTLLAYVGYLRGELDRPMTRLVDCRPFVQLNALAFIAAGRIATIPVAYVQTVGDGYLNVAELPEALDEFISSGRFPSAQGRPWAVPGGSATPADLPNLNRVVDSMIPVSGGA